MMVSSETPAGTNQRIRLLQISFCCFVVFLAIFQLSENTVDVDLWGHITFGEAMLKDHAIAKTDPYSWTATGQPWVNHECLAEIALGGSHELLGGKGPLLLKMVIGLLSFGIALRMGIANLAWPQRFVPWAFGALAVVELSYGFAARPQIFTALFLALELLLLSRIHAGAYLYASAMPVIFAIWINTHGGVLAGFGLLGLVALATTAQKLFQKPANMKLVLILWATVGVSGGAMLINPWGPELIRWLIRSVLWLRPEIEEWNPTPLGWDHAVLFALILLAAFAWMFTRRPRAWWQAAVCGAFALLALRSVRNTPLSAIVLLALVPPHLVDALARFRNSFGRFEELCRGEAFQKLAIVLLVAASAGTAVATLTLHKQNPFTMEIPSSRFPNGAVAFLSEHKISGKALVFFDWGEMVIFHLPDCPPSIDGRLDTCYSSELIKAHWKIYNGEPCDTGVLNPDAADLALLRPNDLGTAEFAKRPDWKVIYYDDTAVVLAHHPERFTQLASLVLPVKGPPIVGLGRVALPGKSPREK